MVPVLRLPLLLLLLVPGAAHASEPRLRQFVAPGERQAIYPGVTFHGDVRVERGVTIAPGATIAQTGTRPVYLLGKTTVGPQSRITQQGDRPLVLLHSATGTQGEVTGKGAMVLTDAPGSVELAGGRTQHATIHGTLAGFSGVAHDSTVVGTVQGGAIVQNHSFVSGLATGRVVIDHARVEGIALGTADGKPHRIEGTHVPQLKISGKTGQPVQRTTQKVSPTERYDVVQVGSVAQGRARAAGKTANVIWNDTNQQSGPALIQQMKDGVHQHLWK